VVAAVVGALGALRESAAVAPFASLLAAPPDAEARRALLRALGRIGGSEAGKALIRELGADEPGREREPVLAALALSPRSFTPQLRECVDTSLDNVRSEGCALGLADADDADSAPRIRAALDRGGISPKVGLSVLARLGDSASLSAALERLTAPDSETRAAALAAAGALLSPREADGRAVEPLARALSARGVTRAERLRLVELLGRTGSPRALTTLLPLLQEASDPALSESAALALGGVPSKAASAALLRALDSEEARVRRAAALAIRRAEPPELLGPLLSRYERSGRSDRAFLSLALFGPLARSGDDAQVARAVSLLASARGSERDTLMEALSRSPRPGAKAALGELSRSSDVSDRAKVAEVTAAAPDVALLGRLLGDVDARVRANAAWALGFAPPAAAAQAAAALTRALGDREAPVVGNAAVSLGRLARGEPGQAVATLCGAPLGDARESVREQALRGLQLAGARCADGVELRLLARDPRARVRRAAAELARSGTPGPAEIAALARCEQSDPHSVVAEACAAPARQAPTERRPATVLVVPEAGQEGIPAASFALLFADGGVRLGAADRRGAVFEPRAPRGPLELLPVTGGD
jgi:cellulose synthase operon protein C